MTGSLDSCKGSYRKCSFIILNSVLFIIRQIHIINNLFFMGLFLYIRAVLQGPSCNFLAGQDGRFIVASSVLEL